MGTGAARFISIDLPYSIIYRLPGRQSIKANFIKNRFCPRNMTRHDKQKRQGISGPCLSNYKQRHRNMSYWLCLVDSQQLARLWRFSHVAPCYKATRIAARATRIANALTQLSKIFIFEIYVIVRASFTKTYQQSEKLKNKNEYIWKLLLFTSVVNFEVLRSFFPEVDKKKYGIRNSNR